MGKGLIRKLKKSDQEKKDLYIKLKYNQWTSDSYLCRKMRKYKKHGKTDVSNQIIVENGVYRQFQGNDGNTWLKIPSLQRGKMLCIPLNSNIQLKGCLRIILKEGTVYIHYMINQRKFEPCGDLIVGVDKGYTEAFADSEGNFYGRNFGEILTEGTEKRNSTGKARNKLHQIAKKKLKNKPKKAARIIKYNLGKKKLQNKNKKQKDLIRNIAFQAAHEIVDTAKEIRAEDLTNLITVSKRWKKYNRLMSSWAKGSLAEALESVSKARGSCLRLVNCAYTSQMDSNTRRLEGRRVGDKFYHVNGDVSQADTNAAVNIKHRGDDAEITLYTSYKEVKKILLGRSTANGGVSDISHDRPSKTPVTNRKRALTESESPEKYLDVRLG